MDLFKPYLFVYLHLLQLYDYEQSNTTLMFNMGAVVKNLWQGDNASLCCSSYPAFLSIHTFSFESLVPKFTNYMLGTKC